MDRSFHLAGVLRLRKLEQEDALAAAAEANRRVRDAHSAEERVRRKLAHYGDDHSSVETLLAVAAARAAASAQLSELAEMIKQAEANAAQAQQRYQEARKATKQVEKLEEKHTRAVAQEDARLEQSALDEAAIQGDQRRRNA